jgi:hypothetical protein
MVTNRPNHLIESWLEEIVADLIAIDLIGPAYLYAFVTFALYMCRSPLRRPSSRYPSPNARFSYLVQRLSNNGKIPATREKGLSELESLWGLRLMAEHRDQTADHNTIEAYYKELQTTPPGIAELDSEVAKIASEIVQQPIYQDLFAVGPFGGDDIEKSKVLTKQLYDGVLIATSRAAQREEPWLTDEVKKNYLTSRLELKETVNSITHILAASAPCKWGWLGQVQKSPVPHWMCADKLFSVFAEPAQFSGDCLWQLWRPISNLDALVSNSIEAVSIAHFYRDGDEGERGKG